MATMGKYCKAYSLKKLREFSQWTECAENTRKEKQEVDGKEVEVNPLLSLLEENNLESLQDKTFTKNLDSRHCGAKINAQMPVISTVENLALIFIFSE